jgi:hypothetical protein
MDNMGTEQKSKSMIDGIINTVKMVITNPVEFYRTMPKAGGFGDPLVFAVVIGVIAGLVQAVIGFLTLSGALRWASLGAVIWGPVGALIGSFIGAAILFVIWKIMGSGENYETAYRCAAYSYAIAPIAVLAGLVPYVGSLVGLAWGLYLVVTASVEVHKIASKTAWLVFGIITAIFALMSVGTAMTARRVSRNLQSWQQEVGTQNEELAVEMNKAAAEAGKASTAMMKALQAQARQAQLEAEKATREAEKNTEE